VPASLDYARITGLRAEARAALQRFQPRTLGQAGRLEGVNPADVALLAVAMKREAT
jgi:tRNA uridine 5-carboxymethylaminomethyl modification enzyme